jgi:hypothetical protein
MSAVQARVHYSMKQEFKLIAGIIRDYTPEEYSYEPVEGSARAKQSDYDCCEVIPVSDPNAATMSQKVVQYQAVMQMAQGNPDIYDMVELNKQMLEILGVKNIGKLIPAADDENPRDPVSENMNLINGKPAKAFMHQDHEAHVQVHMAAMEDPKIAAMIGQSPKAQAVQAAFAAHITEHIAFAYRKGIEEQLGTSLPPVDEKLDETVEVQLSRLVAQAAQQLLQKNQAEQQQQEIQIIAQKTQADIEVDKAKIQVDIMRIQSEERKAGAQIGVKTASEKAKMEQEAMKFEQQQQAEGVRIGVDMAKTQAQHDIQRQSKQAKPAKPAKEE